MLSPPPLLLVGVSVSWLMAPSRRDGCTGIQSLRRVSVFWSGSSIFSSAEALEPLGFPLVSTLPKARSFCIFSLLVDLYVVPTPLRRARLAACESLAWILRAGRPRVPESLSPRVPEPATEQPECHTTYSIACTPQQAFQLLSQSHHHPARHSQPSTDRLTYSPHLTARLGLLGPLFVFSHSGQ